MAILINLPRRLTDATGAIVSGGTYEFYDEGTTTARTVYSDEALSASLGTSVTTNSAGEPENAGTVVQVFAADGDVKVVAKDSADVVLWTDDPIADSPQATSDAASVSFSPTTSIAKSNVQDAIEAVEGLIGTNIDRRYSTSNEVDSGGFTQYDVDRGAGSSLVPVTNERLFLTVHNSPTTDFPVKIRLSDGTSQGDYYEVRLLTGGLAKAPLGPVTNNGTRWLQSAQPSIVFDGTYWVCEETIPIGDGAGRLVQFDSSGLYPAAKRRIFHIQDQKSSGTNGGTFTSGADQTRDLNTAVTNDIPGASLASNQVTLPAGIYRIKGSAPAISVDSHQAILHDTTAAADILRGTTENSPAASNVMTRSVLWGEFTLSVSSDLEIRHRADTTKATNGFGTPGSFGTEIYTDIIFEQVG